jgi:hypothetical protein
MQFGVDWCGVFIRGDDAFNFFIGLKKVLEDKNLDSVTAGRVRSLAKLLESSRERQKSDVRVQRMLPFEEAIAPSEGGGR